MCLKHELGLFPKDLILTSVQKTIGLTWKLNINISLDSSPAFHQKVSLKSSGNKSKTLELAWSDWLDLDFSFK